MIISNSVCKYFELFDFELCRLAGLFYRDTTIVTLIHKNIEPINYGCFFILSEPLNSPKFKLRAHLPACVCVSWCAFFTSLGPQSMAHFVEVIYSPFLSLLLSVNLSLSKIRQDARSHERCIALTVLFTIFRNLQQSCIH